VTDAAYSSENVPSAHAPILQPGSLMCVCGEHADAAAHAPTGGDERCECDSHSGVGDDLWQCDACGEVIRYVDDPNGKVTLTTLHPYSNRRVRVEMVTPGTRPGNRGWWS